MLTVLAKPNLPQPPFELTGVRAPIPHGTAAERFGRALRRHIGRGCPESVAAFSQRIGLSHKTVEKMVAGEATPGLASLLSMQAALPASFTNDLIEVARLTGARRLDGEAQSAALVLAGLSEQAAEIARDLADGRLDHQERAALRKSLPGLIHALQEFQAALAD